jgi:pyrimidine-specific ribonucleoside hydrolase
VAPDTGGPLHVVVDAGLDDALAIAVLVGSGVDIDQVVATEGSLARSATARATARWLATLGGGVPVRLGADRGVASPYPGGRDPFHGEDGFAGLVDTLRPAAEPTEPWSELQGTVLCTGALTVVAEALRRGHDLDRVVWMGGSVACGGNMTAAAEFNAWMDPAAADAVLTAGVARAMVPLDLTRRFAWGEAEVASVRAAAPVAGLLADALGAVRRRDGTVVPHDAVAAVALLEPDLFAWSTRSVRCETTGAVTRGATVVDRRRAPLDGGVAVAEDVDVPRVTDRILAALGRLA